MIRPITGRHMTFVFIAFFGIIIAVNITMAVFASRTFGGTVVDNSYVASQNFNEWLEAAEQQEAYGWTERVERMGDHIEISVATHNGDLGGAVISAQASHPLGQLEPVVLTFREITRGRYRSVDRLPTGRWIVRIEITEGNRRKRILVDLS